VDTVLLNPFQLLYRSRSVFFSALGRQKKHSGSSPSMFAKAAAAVIERE